jgi:ENTS family enterobactin (siderophore) exporter
VRGNKVIRGLMLVDLCAVVLAMPYALFPQMADDVFEAGPTTVGLLYSAPAVGAFLGALASGWTGRARRPGVSLAVAATGWGLAVAAFGLSPYAWLGIVFLAIAGFADTISEILRRALIQHHTPDHLQGRVGSLWLAQATAGPATGNALSGVTARLLGPATTLVTGGLVCAGGVQAVSTTLPQLRGARLTSESTDGPADEPADDREAGPADETAPIRDQDLTKG